jgi:hypothetical protein
MAVMAFQGQVLTQGMQAQVAVAAADLNVLEEAAVVVVV